MKMELWKGAHGTVNPKRKLIRTIFVSFGEEQRLDSREQQKLRPGQGSKKVPSGCPGQVDFPVGQVTFHSHLPNGEGPRQVICQLNSKKSNLI